ncbi:hypothetical protein A4G99_19185 [Haladaptatus sp. R4]|nr:hypothetical protein A4G99_19185 [Haladaptatus sp. R4]
MLINSTTFSLGELQEHYARLKSKTLRIHLRVLIAKFWTLTLFHLHQRMPHKSQEMHAKQLN